MRIIAGKAKGTKLNSPLDYEVRPTSDRAKESLFSTLMPRLNGAIILDLFCGTGALGLEALSRGANTAVFMDQDPVSIRLAKGNAEKTKLSDQSQWIQTALPEGLKKIGEQKFSIVFADPPYSNGLGQSILELAAQMDILLPGGVMIIEHDLKEVLPEKAGNWLRLHEKKIGKARFDFFGRIEENDKG